jgi:hypothetical protein
MAPVSLTDEDVEQIDVLDKVPVADEFVSDSLPGTLSYRRGQRGIIEQQVQPVPETAQIVGIRQQQPLPAVGDLVLDAAHRNVCSISATPPPCAVALTFHTTRSANTERARSAVTINRSARASVSRAPSFSRRAGCTAIDPIASSCHPDEQLEGRRRSSQSSALALRERVARSAPSHQWLTPARW